MGILSRISLGPLFFRLLLLSQFVLHVFSYFHSEHSRKKSNFRRPYPQGGSKSFVKKTSIYSSISNEVDDQNEWYEEKDCPCSDFTSFGEEEAQSHFLLTDMYNIDDVVEIIIPLQGLKIARILNATHVELLPPDSARLGWQVENTEIGDQERTKKKEIKTPA